MVIHNKGIQSIDEFEDGKWDEDLAIIGFSSKSKKFGEKFIDWKYHVVLEYRGFILDLDFEEPKLVGQDLYFSLMFREAIPNTEGLIPDQSEFRDIGFILENQAIPLNEYLKSFKAK